MITADVSGNTFNNNFDPNTGVSMTADGGTINLLSFRNNEFSDNLGTGMRLLATGGGRSPAWSTRIATATACSIRPRTSTATACWTSAKI
ncbi:MAG: hypothetical protein Ct9H300mP1_01600 [Planctomycetaceae bacterium]|nr:MAG: hypothetical protein Ct9H300mP1_01600 [Planctomycetaceae bacterium]